MRCLGPLCGLVVGPLAVTAGTAALLGTLAGLALGACAAAETGRRREPDGAERPAATVGEPEAAPRRRLRRAPRATL
jgi:hypothetical protein